MVYFRLSMAQNAYWLEFIRKDKRHRESERETKRKRWARMPAEEERMKNIFFFLFWKKDEKEWSLAENIIMKHGVF